MPKVKFNGEVLDVDAGQSLRDLARRLGLSLETVLFLVNGELKTEDYRIAPDDEIEVVSVVSGG